MPRPRTRFGSWWRLSTSEKRELLWVCALALLAEIAVKVSSLPRLARALGIELADRPPRSRRPAPPMDSATLDNKARMVDRVYRHWPRADSCLRRALVLGFRIRAARPVLRIGVAREQDEIRAHAWIEAGGRVIGSQAGDWAPLRTHESTG